MARDRLKRLAASHRRSRPGNAHRGGGRDHPGGRPDELLGRDGRAQGLLRPGARRPRDRRPEGRRPPHGAGGDAALHPPPGRAEPLHRQRAARARRAHRRPRARPPGGDRAPADADGRGGAGCASASVGGAADAPAPGPFSTLPPADAPRRACAGSTTARCPSCARRPSSSSAPISSPSCWTSCTASSRRGGVAVIATGDATRLPPRRCWRSAGWRGFASGEVRFARETGDPDADRYVNRDYEVVVRNPT